MNHFTDAYSTESSVVFNCIASKNEPIWAQAHVHFGKYNVVKITLVVTSQQVAAKDGTAFLERLLEELEYKLGEYFGYLRTGVEQEVGLTVFYFGVRVCHAPVLWSTGFRELIGYTRGLVEDALAGSPALG